MELTALKDLFFVGSADTVDTLADDPVTPTYHSGGWSMPSQVDIHDQRRYQLG